MMRSLCFPYSIFITAHEWNQRPSFYNVGLRYKWALDIYIYNMHMRMCAATRKKMKKKMSVMDSYKKVLDKKPTSSWFSFVHCKSSYVIFLYITEQVTDTMLSSALLMIVQLIFTSIQSCWWETTKGEKKKTCNYNARGFTIGTCRLLSGMHDAS